MCVQGGSEGHHVTMQGGWVAGPSVLCLCRVGGGAPYGECMQGGWEAKFVAFCKLYPSAQHLMFWINILIIFLLILHFDTESTSEYFKENILNDD